MKTRVVRHCSSLDGTDIAYENFGSGPAVVLVSPAGADRSFGTQTAALMAQDFTAITYDRRGRGESSDTAPYAVEREIEDLGAVIDAAGGSACVAGGSSGAVLALRGAAAGLTIRKLALYEPPFILDESRPPLPSDYVAQLDARITAGKRAEAVEYYLTVALGIPADMLAQMRELDYWPQMETLAHTLAYDGRIIGDTMSGKPGVLKQWHAMRVPTLVMDGGESPSSLRAAAEKLSHILPNARYMTLPGQTHGVEAEPLADALTKFFAD